MFFGFFGRHSGIRDNYDRVAYLYFTGSRAIEAYGAAIFSATNHIGFETFAIVNVYNVYFFMFKEIGGFHESGVDGNGADVIQIGFSNSYSVYF